MNSKDLAQEVRLTEWCHRQRARRESGLTVRAWCCENGINEKTYYYWQKKLRQAACEQISEREACKSGLLPAPTGWAQVITEPAAKDSLVIEIGNAHIQVTKSTDVDLLTTACRALMSLC